MIDLVSMFSQKATIRRGVQSTSSAGATIITPTVTAQNVPCRIVPMSGAQFERYGRYVSRGGAAGYFDPALTLTAKDVVVCGGRTYEVQFVEDRLDDSGDVLSVFAVLEEMK